MLRVSVSRACSPWLARAYSCGCVPTVCAPVCVRACLPAAGCVCPCSPVCTCDCYTGGTGGVCLCACVRVRARAVCTCVRASSLCPHTCFCIHLHVVHALGIYRCIFAYGSLCTEGFSLFMHLSVYLCVPLAVFTYFHARVRVRCVLPGSACAIAWLWCFPGRAAAELRLFVDSLRVFAAAGESVACERKDRC